MECCLSGLETDSFDNAVRHVVALREQALKYRTDLRHQSRSLGAQEQTSGARHRQSVHEVGYPARFTLIEQHETAGVYRASMSTAASPASS